MRRYQLSGLEHVHMMRHIPRSYDMTRTHIMHKSVNKHVDVVLRCSPKNWKKKKVTVSVVKGEKKNDAARIRANAKKGYVAVRKVGHEQFEADRQAAAAAYEMKYGARSAGSDALIHDMKSQISAMAKKSADYIDGQLAEKSVVSNEKPTAPATETKTGREPVISPESEEILKKGGYRLPNSIPEGSPYAADYLKHASTEEFHSLMDSLEKSLDEACKKYAVEPVVGSEDKTETETEPKKEPEDNAFEFGYQGYAGYSGGYNMPGDISLSVTKKQEIKADERDEKDDREEFKPALTFTDGGEHYIPEDDLFDRELNRPGERYVPPVNFFDEDETAPSGEVNDNDFVPLPDPDPVSQPMIQPQNIFYTEEDSQPFGENQDHPTKGYSLEDFPAEDYEQQQVRFASQADDGTPSKLYKQPQEEEEFADPTMYHDMSGSQHHVGDESQYEPPMVFPDRDDGESVPSEAVSDEEEEAPPMIFPDEDDEAPIPMIFPDEDDEEYSPPPVSPDRHENYDDNADNQGVMDRSGQTLFSRTGDQIKKVIGIIRGSSDQNTRSKRNGQSMQNHNVEITYSDRKN